ncbi:uncharacterized protein EDB93DRAFT_1255833 [Suillus bovinus]|uniref:uncharacterized protein n=1 Tax=Suillus bovinus TaxID=48563 RepID=UPI001B876687|nr:uncharacterized protein EDB93DRAFT_1255833 [Suillus bovinus]KAG2130636.1 hypothetical protein EDB93DRAFT_1255833 [Suillus bovinus]
MPDLGSELTLPSLALILEYRGTSELTPSSLALTLDYAASLIRLQIGHHPYPCLTIDHYHRDSQAWFNALDVFIWPGDEHDDSSSDEEDNREEYQWEPPVQEDEDIPGGELQADDLKDNNNGGTDHQTRHQMEHRIIDQDSVHVVLYPDRRAGQPIAQAEVQNVNAIYASNIDGTENPYAPFHSQMDWEITQWAKLRGPSSTALSDLLSIDGVSEHLHLSYKNVRELNRIIDIQLPDCPKFHHEQVVVAGEAFDIFYRDIIGCIKDLFGNPDFADFLVFAPEHHYTDADETVWLFSDMHTSEWWWNTQKTLDKQWPGATIIPVIISTDKTQVTMFRNKTAYPVYLTIGNILKEIRQKPSRCVQILLGYLPTTHLEHIANKASRHRSAANLYHALGMVSHAIVTPSLLALLVIILSSSWLLLLQEHLDAWAPTIFLLILLVSALASYPHPDLTLVILVILAFPFALYLSLQQSQYIWPDPFADKAYPCSVPPPD